MAGARVSRKEQGEQARQAIVQAAVELMPRPACGHRAHRHRRAGQGQPRPILYHFGSSKGLVLAVLAGAIVGSTTSPPT
jgi:hypothetical protein